MENEVQVRVHAPAPSRTWAGIVSHARTAEAVACVIAAERLQGSLLRIGEYHRLREGRTFAFLGRLAVPASYVAELAVVSNGGEQGIPAVRVDYTARAFLVENALVGPARGSRYAADDWRSHLAATVPGTAVVRVHTGAMPRLTMTEALPLSVIERDMSNHTAGSPVWPGSDLLLRMSQVFRLVEYTRNHEGRAVYRLTVGGQRELDRAREAAGGAKIGARDVALIEEVARVKHGDLGELTVPRRRAVARAIEAGWLMVGPLVADTDRRSLRVTKGGREAADRFTRPAGKPPREPNVRLSELLPGWWVRMANRKGTGVGPEWVKVAEVRAAAVTANMLPGHSEVWVTTDGQTTPFLYANRPLFHSLRFERQP